MARCPAGHQLGSARRGCPDCRRDMVVEIAAAADRSLPRPVIEAAVDAAAPARLSMSRLAVLLAADPGALAVGAPPALRNSGFPVRAQTAHAGRVRAVDPRATSSAASRPASGGAPMASAPGSAASTMASRDIDGLAGAAASTAASITGRGNDRSAAAAICTTVSLRQSGQPRRAEPS